MSHHIYVFGSICRGEVSTDSDVDLLAIVDGFDSRFDPFVYSIYSRRRLGEIWRDGNPFAWHLSIESRLVFSCDGKDVIKELGTPSPYQNASTDCEKFHRLFRDAYSSFTTSDDTRVFDLSAMFLAIRNFATCYLLGVQGQACFSRDSALRMGKYSIPLAPDAFDLLLRARLLSTRAIGKEITDEECLNRLTAFGHIDDWMTRLRNDGITRIRVQQSHGSTKAIAQCRE
ncbi:MAG: nucleotidyltransferase domain-containing protein [Pirellulaceae bacterium]|nr:nucleotidyltransferase domain-containing protein [Pirellulaceae bacterium]